MSVWLKSAESVARGLSLHLLTFSLFMGNAIGFLPSTSHWRRSSGLGAWIAFWIIYFWSRGYTFSYPPQCGYLLPSIFWYSRGRSAARLLFVFSLTLYLLAPYRAQSSWVWTQACVRSRYPPARPLEGRQGCILFHSQDRHLWRSFHVLLPDSHTPFQITLSAQLPLLLGHLR